MATGISLGLILFKNFCKLYICLNICFYLKHFKLIWHKIGTPEKHTPFSL